MFGIFRFIHVNFLTIGFLGLCGFADAFDFEPVQFYKTVSGANVLMTSQAISLVHCASFCLSTSGCLSFDFNCGSLLNRKSGICNIFDKSVSSASELVSSYQCYVQVQNGVGVLPIVLPPATTLAPTPLATTSALPLTTTTASPLTTTSPLTMTSASNVKIYGLLHNNEVYDDEYLLFTSNGIYIYEEVDYLYSQGPDSGPEIFSQLFGGYTDPPEVTSIDCVINTYHLNKIEMYSHIQVYVWDDAFNNIYTTNTPVSTYLGIDAVSPLASSTIDWCVFRYEEANQERHFGMTPDKLFVASNVYTDQMGNITDNIQLNSADVNVWKGLPDNVIAIANHYTDLQNRFIVIDANHSVYQYTVFDADTFSLDYKGQLVV